MFDGFADASNSLFFSTVRSVEASLAQANISLCKKNECKPALFYDFFSRKTYLDAKETDELIRDLKDAWYYYADISSDSIE
jgi:hypothetical protein